jgi:hypothetical protein
MHDYAFSARHRGAYPPEQEARMGEFAERIAAALAEEVDEVLVVGHSSGAYLAVSVLADLIRAGRVPEAGPALSLLTLGQVVPMVSFLPRAGRLRADLALMSETGRPPGSMSRRPAMAAPSRSAIRWRSRGGGAGQTLAAGPVGGVFQDPVGGRVARRCAGGSSSGISSISTPSTTLPGRSGRL